MNEEKAMEVLGDDPKPTVNQVAYVFAQIMANTGRGTFRSLMYERLGYSPRDYSLLYYAGGHEINNALSDVIRGDGDA